MRVSTADEALSEPNLAQGAGRGMFTRAMAWWLRCAAAWRAARRRAADRRLMQAMSARDLRDLGIGRGEARHWAETPPGDPRR